MEEYDGKRQTQAYCDLSSDKEKAAKFYEETFASNAFPSRGWRRGFPMG